MIDKVFQLIKLSKKSFSVVGSTGLGVLVLSLLFPPFAVVACILGVAGFLLGGNKKSIKQNLAVIQSSIQSGLKEERKKQQKRKKKQRK